MNPKTILDELKRKKNQSLVPVDKKQRRLTGEEKKQAFETWFISRNYHMVARQFGVTRQSIMDMAKRHDWERNAMGIERRQRDTLNEAVVKLQAQHVSAFRELAEHALEAMREGDFQVCKKCGFEISQCPSCGHKLDKKLQFKKASEIAAVLEKAIRGERWILGQSSNPQSAVNLQAMIKIFSERFGDALRECIEAGTLTVDQAQKVAIAFNCNLERNPITAEKVGNRATETIIESIEISDE